MPGIRYVVDSGVARISRYSARTKVQRLPIEAISQASRPAAVRPLRPRRGGHRDPALLRGGLRVPAGVHRPRDPAHQPGLGHPPDDVAAARRDRAVPLRRAAGQAHHHRRRPAARGARRHPRRGSADQGRAAAGPAAHRPAAGPDDPRGRAARRPARRPGDRRGAVAAGPARAAGRAAAAGRPAARPLHRQDVGLPDLAQPVALPARAAARAVGQRVPPDVQARAPQLPARPRVAGLRVPAAPGVQGDGHPDRQAGRGRGLRRHPPGPAGRAAQPRRAAGGARRARTSAAHASTWVPATAGSRSSPAALSRAPTRRT